MFVLPDFWRGCYRKSWRRLQANCRVEHDFNWTFWVYVVKFVAFEVVLTSFTFFHKRYPSGWWSTIIAFVAVFSVILMMWPNPILYIQRSQPQIWKNQKRVLLKIYLCFKIINFSISQRTPWLVFRWQML